MREFMRANRRLENGAGFSHAGRLGRASVLLGKTHEVRLIARIVGGQRGGSAWQGVSYAGVG